VIAKFIVDMGVPVSLSIPLDLEEKGSGTCTHRRRIFNVEHVMLNNSTSRRRVCLARNEHSGKAAPPAHHIDFAGSGFACPACQLYCCRARWMMGSRAGCMMGIAQRARGVQAADGEIGSSEARQRPRAVDGFRSRDRGFRDRGTRGRAGAACNAR
jgi:hypothetical protein